MQARIKILTIICLAFFLGGCEVDEVIPTSAADSQQAFAVTLETKRQRVQRYDCNLLIISNKVEVVGLPIKDLEIAPLRSDKTNEISRRSFYNLRTNDAADIGFNNKKLTINYNSGMYMRVEEGLNEIAYEFEFFDGAVERGSRFINVSHKEVLLEGAIIFYPSQWDCPGRGGVVGL